MNTEITNPQVCIQTRSGVEIWIDSEKQTTIEKILEHTTGSRFLGIEGRMVNSADIVGIFGPKDMEDLMRRRNGQWKCQHGKWHQKKDECECYWEKERKRQKEEFDSKVLYSTTMDAKSEIQ